MMWLKLGNSAFFHKVTLIRRRRNLISHIADEDGSILTDISGIHLAFNRFYGDLWSAPGPNKVEEILCLRLPYISADSAYVLSASITLKEALQAVSSMPAGKAPGPNGFHAKFYKRSWNTLLFLLFSCRLFTSRRILAKSL